MTRRVSAILLVLAALVGGCTGDGEQDDLTSVPVGGELTLSDVPKALRPFYKQELTWRDCRSGDQCATLTVPLDYAKPKGRTITLSVVKVPAADARRRLGSMVVNPGGPGGSGIDYATRGTSTWGAALLRSYDLVGFDPRGVGESTPIDCQSDAQLDAYVSADPDPDSTAEWRRYHRLNRSFFSSCMKEDAGLATHMSTVDVAKDMDVLRYALGQPRLVYFGASYGTFIGGTYANLFPTHVGRMVLDGAIDPSKSSTEMSLVQAGGFETALRAYVQNCVDEGSCYLGRTVDEGTARIGDFLEQLDAEPIEGSGGRQVTEGLAVYGIFAPLYDRNYWGILDNALSAALRGSGAQLLALSDAYTRRGPAGYIDNAIQVLPVVNCLDHDDSESATRIEELMPEFENASPTFGRIFASGLGSCADWSFRSGKAGVRLEAKGSAPLLVVGTTRDPATRSRTRA